MNLFEIIPEGKAIIRKAGSFQQVDIYHRAGLLYVEHARGKFAYIKRSAGGDGFVASVAGIHIEDVELPETVHIPREGMGKVYLVGYDHAKLTSAAPSMQIEGKAK